MIRTPESNCLLCIENKSTHKKSHIIPDFLIETMLGPKDNQKGYGIDEYNGSTSEIKDGPYEEYILCSECEQYFSALETNVANTLFRRLRNPNKTNEFEEMFMGEIKYKVCLEVNPKIFQLFIYSIIWRCSISNHEYFYKFKLDKDVEEGLRTTLLCFRNIKGKDLLELIANKNIDFFPSTIAIITREEFKNSTDNWAYINNKNPYYFVINNYIFIFSFITNDKQNSLLPINNIIPSSNKIKIAFISQYVWDSLLNLGAQQIAKQVLKNINNNFLK